LNLTEFDVLINYLLEKTEDKTNPFGPSHNDKPFPVVIQELNYSNIKIIRSDSGITTVKEC